MLPTTHHGGTSHDAKEQQHHRLDGGCKACLSCCSCCCSLPPPLRLLRLLLLLPHPDKAIRSKSSHMPNALRLSLSRPPPVCRPAQGGYDGYKNTQNFTLTIYMQQTAR